MPTRGKIGSADLSSWGFVGENRQRRFFDEHGLDDGLSRPGRKIRPGDTLTKQRWFRHWGSGSPGPDKGAAAAMPTRGKIGSADFSTNTGWTMGCPGQAGKFVQGTR